jgi:hypothetical protein
VTQFTHEVEPDQPLLDTTPYGAGKDDSVSDATENPAMGWPQLVIQPSRANRGLIGVRQFPITSPCTVL